MLPVVIGDAATAWSIVAHNALVVLSLMPVAFGMGLIYLRAL